MTLVPLHDPLRLATYTPITSADVIVFREGEYAVAVDGKTKEVIARSTDHAEVWQKAVDSAPDYGVVVGRGISELMDSIYVKKPLTLIGGYLKRSIEVGDSPGPPLLVLGNTSADVPIVDGPIIVANMVLDGNGREFHSQLGQPYGEYNGAPGGRVAIYVKRVKHVYILNNLIVDHQRAAVNLITVSNDPDIIDHENVVIANNIFVNWGDGAVCVESARRVSIVDNIMVGANPNGNSGTTGTGVGLNYLRIEDVVIEGNIIDGMVPEGFPYAGTYGRIGIRGGDATISNAIVRNNVVRNWHQGIGTIPAYIISNVVSDVDVGISVAYMKDLVVAYNKVLNFRKSGIYGNGTSGRETQRIIVMRNFLDPGDNTPDYGIRFNSYARYNIIVENVVRGTYNEGDYVFWVNYNLCDGKVWTSSMLGNLDLSGFPTTVSLVKLLHYDDTYYYLVIVDLINKVVRKVQLS